MTLEAKVLAHRLFMRRAQELGNVTEARRELGLCTLFYRWRGRYRRAGADSLKSRPPRRAQPTQHAPAAVEAGRGAAYARRWPTQARAAIEEHQTAAPPGLRAGGDGGDAAVSRAGRARGGPSAPSSVALAAEPPRS